MVNYTKVEEVVKKFLEVSTEYELKINPKKSAILLVKGHEKLETDVCGIQIQERYKYLGINIDNKGSIAPHLKLTKQRSNYLRSHMRYFTRDLSFENQYMVWCIYIRPYFTYAGTIIHTQT